MDSDALQLKPFVIIDPEKTEPDSPKEDKAIRPYMTPQSRKVADENNHRSEAVHDDLNDSESQGHSSDSSRRNRIFGKGNIEDDDKCTNSTYKVVIIKDDSAWSCGIVLVNNEIFYRQIESCGFVDELFFSEKSVEAKVETIWTEYIQKTIDAMPDDTSKFTLQFSAKGPSRKDSDANPINHPLRNMFAKLRNKLSNGNSKVCGKRQRKKRLCDLLGAFDTFHYVHPEQLSVVVFPVRRQNNTQGQGSGEEVLPQTSASSQAPRGPRQWPPDSIYGRPWADFRQELYRLGTFASLSASFPVFAVRLAQSGFICLPDGAIVCYFCGVRQDQWNMNNSPEEVHRQLNPICSILTGVNCNNEPVATLDADQIQALMQTWSLSGPFLLRRERDPARQVLGSTEGNASSLTHQLTHSEVLPTPQISAPLNVNVSEDSHLQPPSSTPPASGLAPNQTSAATAAAASGTGPRRLAHTNRNQKTNQNTAVGNIQPGGSAVSGEASVDTNNTQTSDQQLSTTGSNTSTEGPAADARSLPAAGTATITRVHDGTAQPEAPGCVARSSPSANETTTTDRQVVTYQELGIMTDAPKRIDMATINSRVGTFRNWPAAHSQTPMALAEAGFYYAGYADCGRCFQCGGGLKNWEPVDNPWVEHARWFDKCAYLKQCQGQDFIDVVGELNRRGDGERQQISMDQVREEMRNRRAGGHDAYETTVDPAISAALHAGYSQGAVDTAAQRVETEGNMLTLDRLMTCLEQDGAVATGSVENPSEAVDQSQLEDLSTENTEIRQQRQCKICLDREVCVVFLPCGHLVCCAECSPPLRSCPMCRQGIKGRVRAFPV